MQEIKVFRLDDYICIEIVMMNDWIPPGAIVFFMQEIQVSNAHQANSIFKSKCPIQIQATPLSSLTLPSATQ